MANLATNKNRIATGLDIEYDLLADLYDAMTGAKSFDDVTAQRKLNQAMALNPVSAQNFNAVCMNVNRSKINMANYDNSMAYQANLDDLHPNKARGLKFDGIDDCVSITKTADNAIGANNVDIVIDFITPASAPAVLEGLYNTKSDHQDITLGIKIYYTSAWALNIQIGDGTVSVATVALASLKPQTKYTLSVSLTIAGEIKCFINGLLTKTQTVTGIVGLNLTPNATYLVGALRSGGLATSYPFSGILLSHYILNFAPLSPDQNIINNNGRIDRFIPPNYMKWGQNSSVLTNGTFDTDTTGWVVGSNIIDATVADGVLSFTGGGELSLSANQFSQHITALETLNSKWLVKVRAKATTPGSKLYVKLGHSGGINLPAITLTDSYADYYIEQTVTALASVTPGRFSFGAELGKAVQVESIALVKQGVIAYYSASGMILSLGSAAATQTIVANTTYQITTAFGTTDKSNHTNTDGAVGSRFVAKASINLTTGYVKPVVVSSIEDASTNALNATTSGEPTLVSVQVEQIQGQGAIDNIVKLMDEITQTITNPTISVDAGWFIDYIRVRNNGASSMSFKLGTTAGASDVIAETTITAGALAVLRCATPIILNESAARTLYITSSNTTYATRIRTARS